MWAISGGDEASITVMGCGEAGEEEAEEGKKQKRKTKGGTILQQREATDDAECIYCCEVYSVSGGD